MATRNGKSPEYRRRTEMEHQKFGELYYSRTRGRGLRMSSDGGVYAIDGQRALFQSNHSVRFAYAPPLHSP
jgi:hypothetical protein